MFNPQLNFEPSKLWDSMSSIWRYLPDNEKADIEKIWEVVFKGLSALYYNLSQSQLSWFLEVTRGYLETSHDKIPVYTSGNLKSLVQPINLHNTSLKDSILFDSVLHVLSNSHVLISSGLKFWEEVPETYNLNNDILKSFQILDDKLYILGNKGIYGKVENKDYWDLLHPHPSPTSLIKTSTDNIYFTTAGGEIYQLDYLEPGSHKYKAMNNFTASGENILSSKVMNADIWLTTDTNGIWVTDENTINWSNENDGTLTSGVVTNKFEYFDSNVYAATSSGIFRTAPNSISWSQTLVPSYMYLLSDNSLYTGSVTAGTPYFVELASGTTWTGDTHISGGNYYTGNSHSPSSVLLQHVEPYLTASGESLSRELENFIDIGQYNDNLYASTTKKVYKSADGSSWSVISTLNDNKNISSITPSGSLYVTTNNGMLSINNDVKSNFNKGYYYYIFDDDKNYISIPYLIPTLTSGILQEGIDYNVENLDRIKFLKNFSTSSEDIEVPSALGEESSYSSVNYGQEYYISSGLQLLPSISNIFYPAFGDEYPNKSILQKIPTPYISGYNDESSFHEKQKKWADHAIKFCHAAYSISNKQPTLKNLEAGYEIIRGLPFSYKNCFFKETSGDSNYNYLTVTLSGTSTDETETYEIKKPASWKTYVSGEYIPQYTPLVSGINIYDFQSNSSFIADTTTKKLTGVTSNDNGHTHSYTINSDGIGTTTSGTHTHIIENFYVSEYDGHTHKLEGVNPEEKYNIIAVNETNNIENLKYSVSMLETYFDSMLPMNFFRRIHNRPPMVSGIVDKKYYNSNNTITLTALTSDPENDTLYYRWTFKGPYQNHSQTENYKTTWNTGRLDYSETVNLSQPVVDTQYTFNVEVKDGFNTINREVPVIMSGQNNFDSWGDTDFKIGDLNISFLNQTDMNQGI